MQGVQEKLFLFRIHCNPSFAYIAVRVFQGSQRNASVQSLPFAGIFFVQPIEAECWRARGSKLSGILGKKTQYLINTLYIIAYQIGINLQTNPKKLQQNPANQNLHPLCFFNYDYLAAVVFLRQFWFCSWFFLLALQSAAIAYSHSALANQCDSTGSTNFWKILFFHSCFIWCFIFKPLCVNCIVIEVCLIFSSKYFEKYGLCLCLFDA